MIKSCYDHDASTTLICESLVNLSDTTTVFLWLIAINKTGSISKSVTNAKQIVRAVIFAIAEFISNPDKERTRNPAVRIIVVTITALPTVAKA